MSRRAVSIAILVATLAVAALASSSGEAPLWQTVPGDRSEVGSPVEQDRSEQDEPVGEADDSDAATPFPTWLAQALAVAAGGVVVLGAVLAVRSWRPATRRLRLAGATGEALPEVDLPPVDLDADAARAALAEGSPRNGIVACWMQLERDAAVAGMPRSDAETSSEYVERVIASSSVDAGPIRDLAVLFREARFSDHPLAERHRHRAQDLLVQVEAALRTGHSVR